MRALPVLPRTLSRYELLEEIGRGNMGVVYRARDPLMDRTVAIKVIRIGFSLEEARRTVFLERFAREARIAGKLNHPHIVAVHDFGSGEDPFIVMEYFPGLSLSRLCDTGGLPPAEVAVVASQLASALAYAHERGVVHRDVKPANVLYQPGCTKLLDFGIAKLESSELTATGEFLGTPSYMPPEIFSGGEADARSDLFSLGVVLYLLLTGRKPFEAASVSRTIYRVLHEDPEPPSSLAPHLPRGWDAILAKLLAKEPAARYGGAGELLHDLERLSSGEPSARPPLARSPRWAALSAAGVLLVLVTLVIFIGLGAFSLPIREAPPSTTAPVAAAAAAEPVVPEPPALSLRFIARHEHRIGHCTGDLSLSPSGVVFESSRHGEWRWRPSDIERLVERREGALELRGRSPERGEEDEEKRFEFTHLRPALASGALRRYRAELGLDP